MEDIEMKKEPIANDININNEKIDKQDKNAKWEHQKKSIFYTRKIKSS